MTALPNALPTLAAGSHQPGDGKACVMEYVALLAGESWTDNPKCTHPVLAKMAQCVNDTLPDWERHKLVPLIGRLFGTADTGDVKLSVQLAIWCAERVLDKVREQDRAVCAHAIATASRWVSGEATPQECRDAAAAAANAAYAAVNAAANAVNAANAATAAAYAAVNAAVNAAANAAYANAAAAAAANAAYAAVNAAANAANAAADLLALLTGLIDEYDRLTGRVEYREVTDVELADLACTVVGA